MTKKHFQLIADNLRNYARPHMSADAYNELVARMAIDFEIANVRFDSQRFRQACFPKP